MHLQKVSTFFLLSLALGLSFLLTNCNGDPQPEGCKYKPPIAIFAGIDSFENHNFEVTGQNAVEQVFFPRLNMDVELYQSGCNALQQEFRFHLKEAFPLNIPAPNCAMGISGILYELSLEDPNLAGLQQLSNSLQASAQGIAYNEKLLLENSNTYVQIDKTHQTESAILSVIFSQGEEMPKAH